MSAVVVENITKTFRSPSAGSNTLKDRVLRKSGTRERFIALRDVSLVVNEGESVALIGSNGSGKSTLLKLVAGILYPDSGTISCPQRLSALLELGAGFHPDLTGRENVFLNAALLGLTSEETRDRFSDIVEFADLGEFIDAPVRNYSSGMYARLGFAVAVNTRPEVLLVDEVLAVGDEVFQRRCIERMNDLRASGVTIITVSHGVQGLREFCDRVIWLDHGQVKQDGLSSDVIDEYLGKASGLVHATTESNNRILEVGVTSAPEFPWSGAIRVRVSDGTGIERVTIGILSQNGTVLGTWNALTPFSDLETGRQELSLQLSGLPLAAGHYGVSVTLAGPSESTLDWWPASATGFDIAHETGLGEAGFLTANPTWSVKKSTQSPV
jgi:ABC-type polysaccharide/polyol phosphate transport system ATPase subunit